MVRDEICAADKWELSDLYETIDAWTIDKDSLVKNAEEILKFKGRLRESAKTLFSVLTLQDNISKKFSRLYSYASMNADLDTRVSKFAKMKQDLLQIISDFNAKNSFFEPELAEISENEIENFISKESGLKVFSFYLYDLLRRKKYKLSEKEERILSLSSLATQSSYSSYNILSNAEIPYPEMALNDGEKVRLDHAGFARLRSVENRDDRKKAFESFFGTINQYKKTFATQLYGNIQSDVFYFRARGYETSLHNALDSNNIPVNVYYSLIENVNEELDTFYRYLKLKKKMLGVSELNYYDVYAPVVSGLDLKYSFDDAKKHILASLEPLGSDYISVIKQAFSNRWLDVYPSEGKTSGAYSNGSAYDVHPYILLNYNGNYDDISTVTHELGHTMHSYYANKTQPHPTCDYSIFVAEVASTFNENLLIDYMLKQVTDKEQKLSLLMSHLDGIKGTVFRQTQFAEFELKIHEVVESGQSLTDNEFTAIYKDIFHKYYAHQSGVCNVDDLYNVEWAFVPHFYYNFYVYQYATSYAASTALFKKIMTGGKKELDLYLNLLKAGGSDYPVNLLKKAGVDMTQKEPFLLTIQVMNDIMDEIEDLL